MRSRRLLMRGALAAMLLVASAVLALAVTPGPALYGDFTFSTAITDRNGRLLRLALAGDDRYRQRVRLEEVSQALIDATLLYEDRYFRRHPGVNPVALLRAAWATYVTGQRTIGGSTITMQLARLRFDLETSTPRGKLVQIARALQLEWHYSKNEILAAYLNLAPYGGNVEGAAAAALIYFDKAASELSLPEAMALAVVPQHPAARNPATSHGYRELQVARERLREVWAATHGMSDTAALQFAMPLAVRTTRELPFVAPHFAAKALAQQDTAGGMVASTLDLSVQRRIETGIAGYVQRRGRLGIRNASAMLIDHRSMEVLASVGSADFFDDSIQGQVDGTRAKRSPGSTLKPFVYGLALDQGLIHPMTLLQDAPRRFAAYTPENFDRGFMGPIFAKDALIYSRNVPAIELLSRVGLGEFHRFLLHSGVARLASPEHYGLAMVLGGNELTMEELVRLYAMLANEGVLKPLRYRRGAPAVGPATRLLSAESSFLLLDILKENPRPDAMAFEPQRPGWPIAWKTGTSYAFRDAWSVGVFGPWVLAVWVGNFDGRSNPSFVGREAAAPLFFALADALIAELPARVREADPPASLNVRKVEVCAPTGDLPGRHCPSTTRSWFIPGVSPIKVSDVHRAVRVENATGLRACSFDPDTTHEEVFEFWPSDIVALFRRAGLAVRKPPRWSANCSADLQAASGSPPRITSPSAGVTYHVRHEGIEAERLALRARTEGDVSRVYWFADDRYLGSVQRDEPLFWSPGAGRYGVVVVDDMGRSDTLPVTIGLLQ